MEKKARWVLTATAVLLGGMLWWHSSTTDSATLTVQTAAVTVRDIYNSVIMSGEIEAADSTVLCPLQNAVVSAVCVSVGDAVERGEVLCTLQPDISPSAALPDSVQSAWSALSGGQAQSVQAQEVSVLRAPESGTVLSLPAVGEQVYAGVPCIRVADLNSLRVRAQCPELYADQIADGQAANVTVAALSNKAYGATVRSLSPIAVRAVSLTGGSSEATVEAVLNFKGETEGLRPGYSATVKVFTDRHAAAMSVPLSAVCQRGTQEYVFCVENGRAVQHPVKTGYLLENAVEICEGLSPDAVVILSPPDSLTDGATVEVTACG